MEKKEWVKFIEAETPPAIFTLYADGGCRGNPGPCGAGAVLVDESLPKKRTLWSKAQFLGQGTNNEAEYLALILGLVEARARNIHTLTIKMDSLLVVNQIKGIYKVKAPHLKPYFAKVKSLMKAQWSIEHVYRDSNKDADSLANEAMDLTVDKNIVSPSDFFNKNLK